MKEPFQIVFEDDYLIVVNKIVKVLIQPSPRNEKNTLTSLLEREKSRKVFPCHRLDRQTSGLIIYAKSRNLEQKISEEFKLRRVRKKYLAFIKGNLKKKQGVLSGKIIDREGEKFGERAKTAETTYKVLKDFADWSAVELRPLTGRTNQLRIQLAGIGHPVLGEDKYAFRRDFSAIGKPQLGRTVKMRRLALHAFYLSFTHPLSGQKLTLSIGLPLDMQEFLKLFQKDGII